MKDGERLEIYHALLEKSINGELQKHHTSEVSHSFYVHLQTIQKFGGGPKILIVVKVLMYHIGEKIIAVEKNSY